MVTPDETRTAEHPEQIVPTTGNDPVTNPPVTSAREGAVPPPATTGGEEPSRTTNDENLQPQSLAPSTVPSASSTSSIHHETTPHGLVSAGITTASPSLVPSTSETSSERAPATPTVPSAAATSATASFAANSSDQSATPSRHNPTANIVGTPRQNMAPIFKTIASSVKKNTVSVRGGINKRGR